MVTISVVINCVTITWWTGTVEWLFNFRETLGSFDDGHAVPVSQYEFIHGIVSHVSTPFSRYFLRR